MSVIIKDDVINAYSGYNIVNIQKQFIRTALLIMKMSDSTHCINKGFYDQEAIMLTISVTKFLTVLMVTCYWTGLYEHLLCACFDKEARKEERKKNLHKLSHIPW
jgi:hypothetical protein